MYIFQEKTIRLYIKFGLKTVPIIRKFSKSIAIEVGKLMF